VGSFPSVYWLGQYKEGRFDLENAAGPFPLDLGDVLYAPNVLTDKQVGSDGTLVMKYFIIFNLVHVGGYFFSISKFLKFKQPKYQGVYLMVHMRCMW
jgi:hypothetical protein